MILYRADTKGGKTMPEKFGTDGLLTKQVDSRDDPEPHKKYGWLKTIANHIHADDDLARRVYDTTAFLSFTIDETRRDVFLSGRGNRKFASSDKQNADAYVFTANIDINVCRREAKSVYLFQFPCNYERGRTDSDFNLSANIHIQGRCNLHDPVSGTHQLLLIDAVTFLVDKQSTYPEAFSNATRDKEWLLMPCDPMAGGPARLSVKNPCFRLLERYLLFFC